MELLTHHDWYVESGYLFAIDTKTFVGGWYDNIHHESMMCSLYCITNPEAESSSSNLVIEWPEDLYIPGRVRKMVWGI